MLARSCRVIPPCDRNEKNSVEHHCPCQNVIVGEWIFRDLKESKEANIQRVSQSLSPESEIVD